MNASSDINPINESHLKCILDTLSAMTHREKLYSFSATTFDEGYSSSTYIASKMTTTSMDSPSKSPQTVLLDEVDDDDSDTTQVHQRCQTKLTSTIYREICNWAYKVRFFSTEDKVFSYFQNLQ